MLSCWIKKKTCIIVIITIIIWFKNSSIDILRLSAYMLCMAHYSDAFYSRSHDFPIKANEIRVAVWTGVYGVRIKIEKRCWYVKLYTHNKHMNLIFFLKLRFAHNILAFMRPMQAVKSKIGVVLHLKDITARIKSLITLTHFVFAKNRTGVAHIHANFVGKVLGTCRWRYRRIMIWDKYNY